MKDTHPYPPEEQEPWDIRTRKPRRKRTRRPTLASVAKQAAKADIDVARYEIDENGKIIIVTGKPIAITDTDINTNASEWN